MFYVYMPQNCYLTFFGQGLAFFGEDRLATLLCSLARFDLANRGVRQPVDRTPTLDCLYSTRH